MHQRFTLLSEHLRVLTANHGASQIFPHITTLALNSRKLLDKTCSLHKKFSFGHHRKFDGQIIEKVVQRSHRTPNCPEELKCISQAK